MYKIGLFIGGILRFLQKNIGKLVVLGVVLGLVVGCVALATRFSGAILSPASGMFSSWNGARQTDVSVQQTSDAVWAARTALALQGTQTPMPTASLPANRQGTPTPSQAADTEEVVAVADTLTPTVTLEVLVNTQVVATVVSAAPIATFPATGWNPSGIDLTLIEVREQVGGGMDIIGDWTNPNLSRQIVVNPLDRIAIAAVSSDKGAVKVYKADGTLRGEQLFSKGFIYVIALDPGDWFEVTGVGYNIENGHRNTWCEAFVFPSSPTPADLAQILQEWQDREKKPQAASLWIDNTIAWLANN